MQRANINFDRHMEEILSALKNKGQVPRVLLHACCAPCATSCIERLSGLCKLTVYFYNPNIDGEEEYELRKSELVRLCGVKGIQCITEEFNSQEFFSQISGLEQEKEGGARCEKCFKLRLLKTAEIAKNESFDFFATTLTVSPKKNAVLVNDAGVFAEQLTGARYLATDFKKKNGFIRSVEISNELNLYRQNYCGCKFSKPKES